MKVWMNGRMVDWKKANVHILTHALHYGTAIFEGIRCYNTIRGPALFRGNDHFERLALGVKAYQFKIEYSPKEMVAATKKLIKLNRLKEGYVRPICYAGCAQIGLAVSSSCFDVAIVAVPFGKYFTKKTITCKVSSWRRISPTVQSPHIKASANYLNSVLAKKEAQDSGYDEAIMLAENGHVSEGTGENIFVVRTGELITPPLHDGVLAGVTRDSIIQLAKHLGISVREESLLRDELYTADEVFLCGTAAEITPVRKIDGRIITNKVGPITQKIAAHFTKVTHGKEREFEHWLDYIV